MFLIAVEFVANPMTVAVGFAFVMSADELFERFSPSKTRSKEGKIFLHLSSK